MFTASRASDDSESLPAWGGWIEMPGYLILFSRGGGPSPHGEGGLKYHWSVSGHGAAGSLPAWGGWIEIRGRSETCHMSTSLPAWGGWIEI